VRELRGDTLGIEAFRGRHPNELINSERASVKRDEIVDGLRALLELPVELLLPTYGEPRDRAALERALA